jgi:hypothetical protein
MRDPSGLHVTLLDGSSHQAGRANLPTFVDRIHRSASFSSSCGGSFQQATATVTTGSTAITTTEPSSSTSTLVPASSSSSDLNHQSQSENAWLRQELVAKDSTIATLQIQVQNLTQEIRQLRQLPTGKISQIPLE